MMEYRHDRRGIIIYLNQLLICCQFVTYFISESMSVYGRYFVALVSVFSSGLSVWWRLLFQCSAGDRFLVGVVSVIYLSQIDQFPTES